MTGKQMVNPISFSVITKDDEGSRRGVLTKRFYYNSEDELQKDSSQCFVKKGYLETKTMPFEGLVDQLELLDTNQAIIHGITLEAPCPVVAKSLLNKNPEAISRTKDKFGYPDEGLLMFDYDPPDGEEALTKTELLTALRSLHPELQTTALIWRPSASSCLADPKGGLITGIKNQRVYMPYRNGENLKPFVKNLERLAWEKKHGYIFITAAGTALPRCLFDTAVFSPERLDFAAGAVCQDGISQTLPKPSYEDGGYVDLDEVGPVIPQERWETKVESAKSKIKASITKARNSYVKIQSEKLAGASKITLGRARKIVQRRLQLQLMPDDIIFTDDNEAIKVGELLTNPEPYKNSIIRDPLEPEYGRSKAKIFTDDDGGVTINSFAHGGRVYTVCFDKEHYIDWLRQFEKEDLEDMWMDKIGVLAGSHSDKEAVLNYVKDQTGIRKNALEKDLKQAEEQLKEDKEEYEDLTHHQIASMVIADMPRELVASEGSVFYFNGENRWQSRELSAIELDIANTYDGMPKCSRKSDYSAISKHIYTILDEPGFFTTPTLGIATPDYFWQLTEKGVKRINHKPEHRVRYLLPHNMGRADDLPDGTLGFLHWAFLEDPEQIDLLQEIIGAILMGVLNYDYQRAVLLRGKGSNGKGVVLDIIKNLVPKAYRAEVEPHLFGQPLFVAELAGKLVNVVGELPKDRAMDSTDLKRVVDTVDLMGKPIYKAPFNFPSTACHIFSSNHPLQTDDATSGMQRRWLYLDFTSTVAPEDRIPELGRKLVEQEGPQILRWALKGMQRLLKNKTFTKTSSSDKMRRETFANVDNVRTFLNDSDVIARGKDKKIARADLYKHYVEWAIESGYGRREQLKKVAFNDYLIDHTSIALKKVNGKMTWKGVCKIVR